MSTSISTRASTVHKRLDKRYPAPRIALHWCSPWELLVATILSAQCTDERVNKITPAFFARWKTIQELAEAASADIEASIYSTGFFRNKAKNLQATARKIVAEFGGQVPQSMEEMLSLPGVARKTANVVLANAFGVQSGIAVDTHVKRISFRLGLTTQTNPDKVENDLLRLFPQASWGKINHYLVFFGREVCAARKPACPVCELADICPRNGLDATKNQAGA